MLFWVPTLLRLALILLAAVVPGYFFGKTVGLLAALIAVCVLVILQLSYLWRLSLWLLSLLKRSPS